MESRQAQAQLDSIASIIRVADRSLHVPPWIFVIWGLFGSCINAVQQARYLGVSLSSDSFIQLPLLLLAVLATVWLSWRQGGRENLVDQQTGIVFGVIFGVLFITSITIQHYIVSYQAIAIFWGLGMAMGLLIIGIQASRPLLVGGIVLLVASLLAGWSEVAFHGVLGLGWLLGMVVPALYLVIYRR